VNGGLLGCEKHSHGPGRTEERARHRRVHGYGLASRIAAAWATARKRWACFSRGARRRQDRNRGALQHCRVSLAARNDRLFAASINGDAFSDEVKRNAVDVLRKQMAPVDLVIYSLASPKRTDLARAGAQSALKPVGRRLPTRHRTGFGKVVSVTLQPATENEIGTPSP